MNRLLLALLAAVLIFAAAHPAAAQWVRQPTPTTNELYDVVALTDHRLVAVGWSGTLLQTENAGATWTLRDDTNPFADPFRAAFAVDSLFVVAATEYGALYKSLDGGLTWALAGGLPVRQGDFFVYDLHFRSRTDGWIVGSDFLPPYDDFMWHTTDGGATWTSVFLFEDSRSQLLYVDFEGEKGWAGSDGGTFFRTTNGGATWTEGSLPDPGVGIDVLDMEFAADGLTGFAGGWDRYLARSTDGGVTWTLLDFEIGAIKFSDFHFRSPTDVWASTYFPVFGGYDDGIVYHSTDGGQTETYEEVGADPGAAGSFSGIVVTDSRAYIVGFGGFIYARDVGDPPSASLDAEVTITSGAPVPAGGGTVRYSVAITNTTTASISTQYWIEVQQPNGRVLTQGPFSTTVAAGATFTAARSVRLMSRNRAGTYTITARVGTHPATVIDSDAVTFEKLSTAAAADVEGSGLPSAYALEAPSPNPSRGRAVLRFALPAASPVTLSVYDGLGRQVAVLVDGEREAGRHEVGFDATALSLPSGTYVARLVAGAYSQTQRLTVIQ